ncbi:MAG: hypothetical protein JWO15_3626 [Sphingomonadales bacterium]|nr:hypothetical protein [Sphingomonadales bacterium]
MISKPNTECKVNISSPFYHMSRDMRSNGMYVVGYLGLPELVFSIDEYLRRERSTYTYLQGLEKAIEVCYYDRHKYGL